MGFRTAEKIFIFSENSGIKKQEDKKRRGLGLTDDDDLWVYFAPLVNCHWGAGRLSRGIGHITSAINSKL